MFELSLKTSLSRHEFLRRHLKSGLMAVFIFVCAWALHASAESGPDNGTDVVKILFAESQN